MNKTLMAHTSHRASNKSNGMHYLSNGQGRDSYIYGSNGGFSI